MKKCFKCNEIKELSFFYKHPEMADGHVNKCKECNKKDVRENRGRKIDYYREYDAYRFQNDPRVRERHRRYQATPAGKESIRTSTLNYINKRPEARAAHILVGNAVKSGVLIKPLSCSKCGDFTSSRRLHAHHEDYYKPLDVVWLCVQCHVDEHKEKTQ